jgi:hypothetical protein
MSLGRMRCHGKWAACATHSRSSPTSGSAGSTGTQVPGLVKCKFNSATVTESGGGPDGAFCLPHFGT